MASGDPPWHPSTTGPHLSDLAPLLGVAAALIGLADMAPYVRDTVRRSTRPHRGTWLIWTVLAVVVSLSQHADGGSWSIAMAVAQAATNGLVLALAIRFGTGGVSALDVTLIALAGGGVAGWLLAGDPLARSPDRGPPGRGAPAVRPGTSIDKHHLNR